MKNNIDINTIGRSIGRFLSTYQNTLFFIIIGVSIAVASLMLFNIFSANDSSNQASAPSYITESQKATSKSLEELESSSSPKPIPIPKGRFSPFFEDGWEQP